MAPTTQLDTRRKDVAVQPRGDLEHVLRDERCLCIHQGQLRASTQRMPRSVTALHHAKSKCLTIIHLLKYTSGDTGLEATQIIETPGAPDLPSKRADQ